MNVADLINAHPNKPTRHMNVIVACVKACYGCSESCIICADACLSEERLKELVRCIRTDLDCAAICEVTGQLVARQTETDVRILRKQLEACVVGCRICGEECEKHARMHDHCRLCAESCRACEQACSDVLAIL